MGRTKNTLSGTVTGVLKQLVNIVFPFISRTVILYVLGKEYLGLSGLFSSLLSFLALAELGVSNALVFSMYRSVAEKDDKTTRALLSLYKKLYRIIGLIILCVGLVCMPFIKVLIKGDCPNDVNVYILYALYLLNTVISYFLFAYRGSLLTAHQRTDIDNIINSIIPAVVWVVQMAFLFVFKSYYAYVIFLPISTIITNIVRYIAVRKTYPSLYPEGELPSDEKQSIYKKIKALLFAKISTTVLHSSDNIVISAFLGLSMVTIYDNYHYIMNAVCMFTGTLYVALGPSLGNSLVTESTEKNYTVFKNLSFLNNWIISWCAVCLLCLYQPFMKLWAGEDSLLPFAVVVLIVIYFIAYQGRRIVTTFKDAAGLWWEDRFRPLVMALTNLISNLIMVQFIGVFGIVLSTILSLCVSIPWETYTVFKYVFKRSAMEYVWTITKYMAVFLVAAAATYGACQVVQEGIVAIIVRAAICVVLPNLIFLLFFARQPEFKEAKDVMLRMVKKRG